MARYDSVWDITRLELNTGDTAHYKKNTLLLLHSQTPLKTVIGPLPWVDTAARFNMAEVYTRRSRLLHCKMTTMIRDRFLPSMSYCPTNPERFQPYLKRDDVHLDHAGFKFLCEQIVHGVSTGDLERSSCWDGASCGNCGLLRLPEFCRRLALPENWKWLE